MNVVVFGVTGYAGGHIAAELLERGHGVTGVARSKPDEIDPHVTFQAGSIHDAAILERLASSADAVVLAMRATAVAADGQTYAGAVRPLVPNIAKAGARLGVVGGAGSLRMPGTDLRLMDRPEMNRAHAPEANLHSDLLDLLRQSDELDWFYVSPPIMFGSYAPREKRGTYRLGLDEIVFDAEGKSHISGGDYALAFVDELEPPAHRRQRFSVGE